MASFPFYRQLDSMDCGVACLRMIGAYYGKFYPAQWLREQSYTDREGATLLGISDAAERMGFTTMGVRLLYEQLLTQAPKPCIVHWQQRHFVVVYKVTPTQVYVADPAFGLTTYTKNQFLTHWATQEPTENSPQGIALLFEPNPDAAGLPHTNLPPSSASGFRFLLPYLRPHRAKMAQILLVVLLAAAIQFVFPFLTKALIDRGVSTPDLPFLYLLLLAQALLFAGKTAADFVRSRLALQVGSRVNKAILSHFLLKLLRLPIRFFDTKLTGDLLQRIYDHHRIEALLTHHSLNVLFAAINLLVFGVVLFWYSLSVFAVFTAGSLLYMAWISLFLTKRRQLDHERFDKLSDYQNNMVQLITGMPEIKLNNFEQPARQKQTDIQDALFHINLRSLTIEQYQQLGALFFNEFKNIIIVFLAAQQVINGSITLGTMLAITYITGQLNAPIAELARFLQQLQDAQLSMERLNEIHQQPDEPMPDANPAPLPPDAGLQLTNVGFRYGGAHAPWALQNISLHIPPGKVTAIVGSSGSGKTTLLKLLLRFYEPQEGSILLGNQPLQDTHLHTWRQQCGVVMQDGFIFSESVAVNIAMQPPQNINRQRLTQAAHTANILSFIEELPLGFETKIGPDGLGLSGGQKQRILIARAVYKNPMFLFFDEATNALDAQNERIIMQNLQTVFEGKTVIVVAHRLSTVQNAHQIIVLNNGIMTEQGTHAQLTAQKGNYYQLIRNQLELGT